MSFFGFSDHDDAGFRDSTLLATRLNYIIVGFASVLFFISGVFNTERDLFSTAFWFDHINVQQAGVSANYLFQVTMVSQTVGVTAIAMMESLAIWSAQVVFGFLLAKKGRWSQKSEGLFDFIANCLDGNDRFANISREKLFWFMAVTLAATMDTATDIGWLAGGGGDLGNAILVSLVFHNIFSELALFWGGKLAVESVVRMLGSFLPRGRNAKKHAPQQQQNKSKNNNHQRNRNQQQRQQQRPQANPRTHRSPVPIDRSILSMRPRPHIEEMGIDEIDFE